eukprot:FR734801.1.p1 GENE.FR734801.1~~FR734801.1.p1  ORF type:complete len:259 (+),score=9.08 FR734801.1:90-779(+)
MGSLNTMLGTIFCIRMLIGNLVEVMVPAYKNYKSEAENRVSTEEKEELKRSVEATLECQHNPLDQSRKVHDQRMELALTMTAIEEQYVLEEYDTTLDLFSDYQEMVIQFGYATLFSCSFTLAPMLAYVNNYVEIRVDAWKICTQCRRSLPGGAEDIGTWQDIMELMSYLAITTNLLIVIFTASDSSGDGVFSGVTAKVPYDVVLDTRARRPWRQGVVSSHLSGRNRTNC